MNWSHVRTDLQLLLAYYGYRIKDWRCPMAMPLVVREKTLAFAYFFGEVTALHPLV